MPRQGRAPPAGGRSRDGRRSHRRRDGRSRGGSRLLGSRPTVALFPRAAPLFPPIVPLCPPAAAGGARRSPSTGRYVPPPPIPEPRRLRRLAPTQRTTRALPVVRACWLPVLRPVLRWRSTRRAAPNRGQCWAVARPRSTPGRPTTARASRAPRGRGTNPAAERSAALLDRTSAPATVDPGGGSHRWSGARLVRRLALRRGVL